MPAYLWVEDKETRAYLQVVWPGAQLGIYIAPGKGSVQAAVHDAYASGFRHVFGLSDRDFGKSNRERWSAPDLRQFILPEFEIENLLLSADALAAAGFRLAPGQRTAKELEEFMTRWARESVMWMAVRRVIASVRDGVFDGFPTHPSHSKLEAVRTIEEAVTHLTPVLVDSVWRASAESTLELLTPEQLRGRLQHEHALAQRELEEGKWRTEWSGKEVFSRTIGELKGYRRALRLDIVKGVGKFQVEQDVVPQSLVEIRGVIGV
jgi:hypothetical protein